MIGNIDYTMLRQMTRRARVEALLHDSKDSDLHKLATILDPLYSSLTNNNPTILSGAEQAHILAQGIMLTDTEYRALLQYLHLTGRPDYRAYDNYPHPLNSVILLPQVQSPLQIHRGECTFSCKKSHKGNSAIQFYNPLTQSNDTGFIHALWKLPLEGFMRCFVVVHAHKPLPEAQEGKAPYVHFNGFQSKIVDVEPSNNLIIIEPDHIITHLTTFERPVNTYGINSKTLVICWALNRGRK